MSSKPAPPIELILILLILLLAFALRVHALDRQSFWNDEGLTVHYASTPATELIQRMRVGFHNPLYFLSLHFWMDVVGRSDWAIRFYSLMLSTLAVPLLYTLGRLLYGKTAGLLAALILAANPFAVYYAQEARMYAQVLSLSAGMMLVFILALRRDRPVYWLGYALLAVGCLYTHYFAALAPLAAAVYYVVSWLSGRFALESLASRQRRCDRSVHTVVEQCPGYDIRPKLAGADTTPVFAVGHREPV
jgi:4-amino-4-deoxy-L-arabinose transferase-like glycosyltransferase